MLDKTTNNQPGDKQLTLRSLIIGAIGSALLTASSMYVALRMGALPWPTVFAAIASMSILKMVGNTSLNEINVTQTAMTAGAMISGGLAFTLPGLWALEGGIDAGSLFIKIFFVALAGLILGLALTWYWRPMLLEQEKLPFPIGIATAETIKAGDEGGRKAGLLVGSLGAASVFTLIRDWFGKIPQMLSFSKLAPYNIQAGLMLWPMAPAIGYMIGLLYTVVLMVGAVLAFFVIIPIGVATGIFADASAAEAFKNTIGLGLMVGSGLGVLVQFIWKRVQSRQAKASMLSLAREKYQGKRRLQRLVLLIFLLTLASCLGAGMNVSTAVITMAGVALMTLMACLITGQTGIDPMEIFGIIVMMAVTFLTKPDIQTSIMVAAVVAVASGFAGDTMFDYKTGHIIGTDPRAQLISQGVGGLLGVLVSSLTIFVIIAQFGPVFDEGLPAPQAAMVFSMVNQSFDTVIFWCGAALGIVLVLLRVPSTTLGIGMYLPFGFSLAIFLGGLINELVKRFWPKQADNAMVVASGVFGGESLTGVMIAFLSFFKSI